MWCQNERNSLNTNLVEADAAAESLHWSRGRMGYDESRDHEMDFIGMSLARLPTTMRKKRFRPSCDPLPSVEPISRRLKLSFPLKMCLPNILRFCGLQEFNAVQLCSRELRQATSCGHRSCCGLSEYTFLADVLIFDARCGWRIAYTCRGVVTHEHYLEFGDVPHWVGRRMSRSWIAIGGDNDVRVRVTAFSRGKRSLVFDGHAHGFADGDGWAHGDVPLQQQHDPSGDRRPVPKFHRHGILGLSHSVLPDIDIHNLISTRVRLRLDWRLGYHANCYDLEPAAPPEDLPTGATTLYAHFTIDDPERWLQEKDAPPTVISEYMRALEFT